MTGGDTRRDDIARDLLRFMPPMHERLKFAMAQEAADALLAGPLADLAALPERVHQLADGMEVEADDEAMQRADTLRDVADRLRALTPDPRQEQQQ